MTAKEKERPFVRRAPFGDEVWITGCVGDAEQVRNYARKIPDDCDLLELRLDLLKGMEDAEAVEMCRAITRQGLPVLLTLRIQSEGGGWAGTAAQRRARLLPFLPAVAGIDVEGLSDGAVEWMDELAKWPVARVLSYHNFDRWLREETQEKIYAQAVALRPTLLKVAAVLETFWDVDMARRFVKKAPVPMAFQGMGPLGIACRVPYTHSGSRCVYGALGAELVPGQPDCHWLAKMLGRLGDIPRRSKKSWHEIMG